MEIHELLVPPEVAQKFAAAGGTALRRFMVNACLQVYLGLEHGELHLSVSHPRRYPTWDEIRDIRYALLPNEKTFGLLLPPKEEYVNVHPNCFHLHEVGPPVKEQPLIIVPGGQL